MYAFHGPLSEYAQHTSHIASSEVQLLARPQYRSYDYSPRDVSKLMVPSSLCVQAYANGGTTGHSAVAGAKFLAGPLFKAEELLVAELDPGS